MRVRSVKALLFGFVLSLASPALLARAVFFPQPVPNPIPLTNAPAWLAQGAGDDGYIRVEATSSMKSGCVPLGTSGFLKLVATEKVQLTVAVKVTGLPSILQGREIPLAVLDGRTNAGGCLPLTILDTAMTIVPLARLERQRAGVPSQVKFELVVRSTNESKLNVVGPTQTLLGVAAVFATGGPASTVTSLASALAQPAFKQLENALDAANSGITPGISSKDYSWQDLRKLGGLTFPVYLGKAGYGEDDATAIPRLQRVASGGAPEFNITLLFSYYPTAFDLRTSAASGLPSRDDLRPSTLRTAPNVVQLIESAREALRKASSPGELSQACSLLVEQMNTAGYVERDRSIALVETMNATRSDRWYQTELGACTTNVADLRKAITDIYGQGSIIRHYYDARDRYVAGDDAYTSWYQTGVPFLDRLAKVLTEPSATERQRSLKRLSGNSDIDFDAPAGGDEWPYISEDSASSLQQLPELRRLAGRQLATASCFSYQPEGKFDPSTTPGDMVVADDKDRLWLVTPTLAPTTPPTLKTLRIARLDKGWAKYYETAFAAGLYGSPMRDDCRKIAPKISATANAP